MPERNQDVFEMIDQVRARLKDLEQEVHAFEGDLPGMAEKLDRIDDKLYLLVAELEKKASNGEAGNAGASADGGSSPAESASAAGEAAAATTAADDDEDGGMNILTPEAKQKLGETVGDMREIGRDAAAAFTELNEAFSDITEPFKVFTKSGRRRF